VNVTELTSLAELAEAADLFTATWPGQPPAGTNLLRAISHAGGYVAGARDGRGVLVGAAMGFLAEHDGPALHSHLAAVSPALRGQGVGLALKLHQREWALAHGLVAVTWTFDPLVRRNAWFNLGKLGAGVDAYLPDFYGPMDDGINDGDETDRLFAVLPTREAAPRPGPGPGEAVPALEEVAGAPRAHDVPPDADLVAVATPPDVESLRRTDPALALRWRHAVRDALAPLVAAGTVTGFTREGSYLVRRSLRQGSAPP
jgi:predicted GNAT superfamily acetyltransferase